MRTRFLSKMNVCSVIALAATLAACSGDNSPAGGGTTGSGGGGSGSGSLGGGSGSTSGDNSASGTFGGASGSGTFGGGSGSGSTSGDTSASGMATSGMATSGDMAASGMAASGMATSGMATSGMASSGMMAGGPPFATAYAIIQAHCLPCHSPGMPAMAHAGFLMGMLDMSSQDTAYTNLVGVAAMAKVCTGKGMRVVAGNSAMSILYTKVAAAAVATCGPKMPLTGAKLTAAQVTTIKTWIDMGANK